MKTRRVDGVSTRRDAESAQVRPRRQSLATFDDRRPQVRDELQEFRRSLLSSLRLAVHGPITDDGHDESRERKEELDVPREPPSRLPREQFLCFLRIVADFCFGYRVLRLLRRELGQRRAQCSRGAPRGWEERRGLNGGERGQEAARHRFGALQTQHGRLAAGESHSAG